MRCGGILTRLDAAFSRDQREKIYVQHRMQEHAPELWAWLEDGAHLYVCGDAKRMAKDVDAALHELIQKAGGKNREQASEYVTKMKTDKRYQRDVYIRAEPVPKAMSQSLCRHPLSENFVEIGHFQGNFDKVFRQRLTTIAPR